MTKKTIIDPVNRNASYFEITDIDSFKKQMLNWVNRFNIFIFLDSHGYHDNYSQEEWMLAAGVVDSCSPDDDVLTELDRFISRKNDWLFGHLSYDLKNHLHPLTSVHPDLIQFPDIFLFQPDILIRKTTSGVEISTIATSAEKVFQEIVTEKKSMEAGNTTVELQQRIPKEEYLQIIEKLKQHILRGDCYEINFCQEFFAENAVIDPLSLYEKLSALSPTPFGGFYKLGDKYLLCASPERFLQKNGSKIISQPIKGTIRREPGNAAEDQKLRQQLASSQKDKSENVMIVDLMRNDLSRICKEGTVQVEELYGIYSFPQVHQMISTVVGELREDIGIGDILSACFPMGSMTGAPKRRVMELTEQYEKTGRGIYSGSIGYITPDKNFDWNVVIRSIMYNESAKYLSYQVGGGITFYSDAEKEYEECLLKAAAIKKVLV